MTIENVSIWLMANFGADYVKFLALPVIVFVVLSFISKLTYDKREFMRNGSSESSDGVGLFFGFIAGLGLLYGLNLVLFKYASFDIFSVLNI